MFAQVFTQLALEKSGAPINIPKDESAASANKSTKLYCCHFVLFIMHPALLGAISSLPDHCLESRADEAKIDVRAPPQQPAAALQKPVAVQKSAVAPSPAAERKAAVRRYLQKQRVRTEQASEGVEKATSGPGAALTESDISADSKTASLNAVV